MDLIKANDDYITINIPLKRCRNCFKPMLGWSEQVPAHIEARVKREIKNLVKEHFDDFGTCSECIKRGGFRRECECCGGEKEFPKGFRYSFTRYAKYPEDETSFYYVCNDCVIDRPQKVMDMFIDYDDASEIEK